MLQAHFSSASGVWPLARHAAEHVVGERLGRVVVGLSRRQRGQQAAGGERSRSDRLRSRALTPDGPRSPGRARTPAARAAPAARTDSPARRGDHRRSGGPSRARRSGRRARATWSRRQLAQALVLRVDPLGQRALPARVLLDALDDRAAVAVDDLERAREQPGQLLVLLLGVQGARRSASTCASASSSGTRRAASSLGQLRRSPAQARAVDRVERRPGPDHGRRDLRHQALDARPVGILAGGREPACAPAAQPAAAPSQAPAIARRSCQRPKHSSS